MDHTLIELTDTAGQTHYINPTYISSINHPDTMWTDGKQVYNINIGNDGRHFKISDTEWERVKPLLNIERAATAKDGAQGTALKNDLAYKTQRSAGGACR